MNSHIARRRLILIALSFTLGFLIVIAAVVLPVQAADFADSPEIDVSGHITTDATWLLANSPYIVTSDVTIDAGVTLTIEAGVVVKFDSSIDGLHVYGTLIAVGTESDTIYFTSINDNSVGGVTGSGNPTPDNWSAIRFHDSSTNSILDHTFVGYGGGWPADENVWVNTRDITITNSTIASAFGYGIKFNNTFPPSLSHNTFISNTSYAVYASLTNNSDSITLIDNSASGNGNGSGSLSQNGFAAAGSISGTVTWDWQGGDTLPFVVVSDLTVNEGANLTLTPGTAIKFDDSTSNLHVYGSLNATGTVDEPIVFTSEKDDTVGGDTNGDGASSNPGPDNWSSLVFHSTSSGSALDHAIVSYGGGWPADENVWVGTRDITITNSTIASSMDVGIRFYNVLPPTLSHNTFISNTSYAVYAWLDDNSDSITLIDNNASGNGNGTGSLSQNGFATTGSISGTVTWDWQGGDTLPFVVVSDLTVNEGANLTLTPGTAIKFDDSTSHLHVYGSLTAIGSDSDPIIFTSEKDDTVGGDTNGDGASSNPGPDNWSSLVFHSTSSGSVLDHAIVRYGGGWPAYENVWINTDGVLIRNSIIEQAYGRGLTVEGASPRIEGNTFVENDTGIYTGSGSRPFLRGNVIVSNTLYGLFNNTPVTAVDAQENWWGAVSGPYHSSENPGGLGDRVSDGVIFYPWLGEFAWTAPGQTVFHDTERLAWAVFGRDVSALTADLSIRILGGSWSDLAVGLEPIDEFYWNTLGAFDGYYELRVRFKDASDEIVGETFKQVLVLNDEHIVWHEGRIENDETWSEEMLHMLVGDVTVANGVTVTVEAGTVIKAIHGSRLTVEDAATLSAQGTPSAPTYFTSLADDEVGGDTNQDGETTQPSPGDWFGIALEGSGQFIESADTHVLYFLTTHGGTLAFDETWNGSSVHVVASNVIVPSGITLTIEPDAVVKFDEGLNITVQTGGNLVAIGNVAQPIILTSIFDDASGGDSNNDGDASPPFSGDWRGIVADGGHASLDYLEIYYGGGTPGGAWDESAAAVSTRAGGTVSLDNSIIHEPFFEGLIAWGSGTIHVTSTIIVGADRGVNSDGSAAISLLNCTLDRNRVGIWGHGGDLVIANTIIAKSLEYGIDNILSSPIDIRYSNVWSESGENYFRHPDQTGLNGNISVDPAIADAASKNYRLEYVSPMIDAADGMLAPETDFMGIPRYDDPRSTNTGLPTPGGAYADIGAFEFVETAASTIDLVASNVSGPEQILAGETVVIEYTVTFVERDVNGLPLDGGSKEQNASQENGAGTVGPWHDSVTLVSEFGGPVPVLEVGEVFVTGGLAPGESTVFTATVSVPGGTTGPYRWQVRVNSSGEVFEGQNWSNNSVQATTATTLDVPILALGSPVSSTFAAIDQASWYKLAQPAWEEVDIFLDSAASDGSNRIYAGAGYMPTEQLFDHRSSDWNSADALLSLPAPQVARTIYLLVLPDLPSSSNLDYTVSADPADFSINGIGLSQGSNAGSVTVPIYGSQFTDGLIASLDPADGSPDVTGDPVVIVDSTTAHATFDLVGVTPGTADVVVELDGGSERLTDAFTIVTGPGGELQASLLLPQVVRIGRWFGGSIEYSNSGGTDLPTAILVLEGASSSPVWLDGDENEGRSFLQLLTVDPDRTSGGVLSPGEKHSLDFRSVLNSSWTNYELTSKNGDSTDLIDWEALRLEMRPTDAEAIWDQAWDAMVANTGTTYGDYIAALAQAADEAHQYDIHTNIVGDLLNYMIARETINITSNMVGGTLYRTETGEQVPFPGKAVIFENIGTGENHMAGSWHDGRFGFWDVGPGTYSISVPDVLSVTPEEVTVTASGILTGLDIVVDMGAKFSGRVVNAATGAPLLDAIVTAEDVVSDLSYSSGVDDAGYYLIEGIDPSLLKITALSAGYVSPDPHVVDMSDGNDATLILSLSTGGNVAGHVLTPGGSPAAYAWVSAGTEDGEASSATLADASGYYEINGLAPGSYWITANSPGYAYGLQVDVVVEDSASTNDVDIDMINGGSVSGTIIDTEGGTPIHFAWLVSNDPFVTNDVVTTTVSGSYTLADLPPGNHDIYISADGYLGQAFPVTVSEGTTTVLDAGLRPAGTIAGIVQRQGGTPVEDMLVSLVTPLGDVLADRTTAAGEFSFSNLADGEYILAVGMGAGLSIGRQSFTLSNGSNSVNTIVELEFTILSGTVHDSLIPVGEASVWLIKNDGVIDRTTTDEAGEYRFLVFQGATYDILASGKKLGMAWLQGVNLSMGSDLVNQDIEADSADLTINVSAPSAGYSTVADALVQLKPADLATNTNSINAPLVTCSTDAAGSCLIENLTAGTYELTVRADGLALSIQQIAVPPSGSTVNVELESGQVIYGQIVDENFAGLPAWTSASEVSGDSGTVTIADVAGFYEMDELPQDVFDLWFFDGLRRPVLASGIDTASLPEQNVNITLPSSGAAITGTVSNDQGLPLIGAVVAFVDKQGISLLNELTDAEGEYVLSPLPTGVITLRVNVDGYDSQQTHVIIPSTVTVTQDINLGDPVALAADYQLALFEELLADQNLRRTFLIQSSLNLRGWVTSEVPPPRLLMSWDRMDEFLTYPALPYECDPYNYYNRADRSREVVINTFYAWKYAYRAAQQVGTAEVNYTIFNGALVASKAYLTIANLAGFNIDDVPAWAQSDMLLIIDILTSIANGSIDQTGMALSEWSSIMNHLEGAAETYGGNLLGIVAMLRDFYLFYDDVQQSVANIDTAMVAYQNANAQYVAAVRRHHTNIRLLKATVDSYQKTGLCPPPDTPLPPEEPRNDQDQGNLNGAGSLDPNDKSTIGYGPEGWITGDSTILYTIRFENVPTATAAAQTIFVTDQLDTSLDWSTFHLKEVGFNNVVAFNTKTSNGPIQSYSTQTYVATDPNPVEVMAWLDTATGLITWEMESVDLVTGGLPEDPLAGFLPPNDDEHRGEGYAIYSILPKQGSINGQAIYNEATIVFDVNEPIQTNQVTNTIDLLAPSSSVDTLPSTTTSPSFTVSWSGDDGDGSGIAAYDVYVSENGGAFVAWQTAITETEAIFTGTLDHTYGFFSVATDNVGHQQPIPAAAQAITTIGSETAIAGLQVSSDSPTPLGNITNLSAIVTAGSNVAYQWDFGDGSFGSGAAVQHTYATVGQYSVIVTASNTINTLSESTQVIVEETISGLTVSSDGPTTLGEITTLTAAIAAGSNVSYLWDFGDGNSGSGVVIQHAYSEIGQFTVILTATNLVSMETTSTTVSIVSGQIYVFIPMLNKPD